jgi:isochorismate pyruvate lyase
MQCVGVTVGLFGSIQKELFKPKSAGRRRRDRIIGPPMKTPTDCASLTDVRTAIDHVDEQILALLGLRAAYVRAAAPFKASVVAVAAPERQAAMLHVRRQWAEREGLDPDFVEKLYRDLVAYFISRELEHWSSR